MQVLIDTNPYYYHTLITISIAHNNLSAIIKKGFFNLFNTFLPYFGNFRHKKAGDNQSPAYNPTT